MMPCSCGASCGLTSCAPDARKAILSDQNSDPNAMPPPRSTAKKMIAPLPTPNACRINTSAMTRATKTSPSTNIVRPIRACSPLSGA